MDKFRRLLKLCVLLNLCVTHNANSAVFQLYEPGAGGSARANDASTTFTNPAGLVRLKNPQAIFSATEIIARSKFTGTSAWRSTFGVAPTVSGTSTSNIKLFLPGFFFATPINSHLAFGFSVNQPFGSKTSYSPFAQTRYASVLNEIRVIDMSPSLGVKLNDNWSLGAGLDFDKATIETEVVTGIPSLFGRARDTRLQNTLSDRGYGYHAGALYQVGRGTRIGVGYHSQVALKMRGKSQLIGPLAAGGNVSNNDLWLNIMLPPITTLSVVQHLSTKLTVMGSANYTQWNRIRVLYARNVQGAAAATRNTVAQTFNFHNSWKYSLGTAYLFTPNFLGNLALSYDQSATNNTDRSISQPANGTTMITVGGKYNFNKQVALGFTYGHSWWRNAPIANTTGTLASGIVTTTGNDRVNTNIFSAQIIWDIV